MRLFVAVDLSEELKEVIGSIAESIGVFKGVKPVEKHNLHITLMFLGEVPDRRVEIVKEQLRSVEMSGFKIGLKGIGFFPSPSSVRVVWVGVEEGKDDLCKLAGEVEKSLKKLGFKRDKEFVAHATIARVKRITPDERDKMLKILNEYLDYDFGTMDVSDFRLKKSTLTPKGPIYEDLEVYKLKS